MIIRRSTRRCRSGESYRIIKRSHIGSSEEVQGDADQVSHIGSSDEVQNADQVSHIDHQKKSRCRSGESYRIIIRSTKMQVR